MYRAYVHDKSTRIVYIPNHLKFVVHVRSIISRIDIFITISHKVPDLSICLYISKYVENHISM